MNTKRAKNRTRVRLTTNIKIILGIFRVRLEEVDEELQVVSSGFVVVGVVVIGVVRIRETDTSRGLHWTQRAEQTRSQAEIERKSNAICVTTREQEKNTYRRSYWQSCSS